jgi:hypothetical protein
MTQVHTIFRFLFLTLAASFLVGCGVIIPGTPWSDVEALGPMLFNGDRAKVIERCAIIPPYMSRGRCEIGFIDQNKTVIRSLDIQHDVDAFIKQFNPSGLLNNRKTATQYKMYLLTISPVVVLAVPKSADDEIYCGVSHSRGCIQSTTDAGSYFYLSLIKALAGSFWFAPDIKQTVSYLPDNSENIQIDLPDSKIMFVPVNGGWSINRSATNP